jgi:hypothetical protein
MVVPFFDKRRLPMLLDVVVISFLIAFLRGGRIKELPKFERMYFLWISILFQLCSAFFHQWGGIFISFAYLFTFVFFIFNWKHFDMKFFSIGWFLNAVVIWTNGGKMPIDLTQAAKLPYSLEPVINGTDFKHTVLQETTNLPYLADIIYMPYIFPRVISIGDIFIMIGAFLLVQRLLNKPITFNNLKTGV